MIIITVTGYKGGVGKSTTAIHLATYFAKKGSTLLVDGDLNRTALNWAERSDSLSFDVVDERQAVRAVNNKDFVIVDTPARPDSDDLQELAKGCDLLVLPTSPDVVSLEPMLQTARVLGAAKYWALITIVPPKPSKEGEAMQNDLRAAGIPVFDSMIRRTVGFAKAALEGVSIRDLKDSRMRGAWEDYKKLGDEIIAIAEAQNNN